MLWLLEEEVALFWDSERRGPEGKGMRQDRGAGQSNGQAGRRRAMEGPRSALCAQIAVQPHYQIACIYTAPLALQASGRVAQASQWGDLCCGRKLHC